MNYKATASPPLGIERLLYMTLDVLACPYCKDEGFPLKLYVIEERTVERKKPKVSKPYCDLYCGYKRKFLRDMKEEPPCDECIHKEIVTGVLVCPKCGRWYPIIDEIPHMLPDELRNKQQDVEFLKKYKDVLPEEVLKGKPWGLEA